MAYSLDLAQAIHNVVINPDIISAFVLLVASMLNDLVALLPANLILSGQILFVREALSYAFFLKLFLFVALPVGIGATIGSFLTYGLAYFGGKPGINKFGKYLRFSWKSVEHLESKFTGLWYDEAILILLRAVPFLPPLPVNIAAGIIRMNFVSYVLCTFVGNIIKVMVTFGIAARGMVALAQ
jgi:membrane protein YqaA with SNARE-associated domain